MRERMDANLENIARQVIGLLRIRAQEHIESVIKDISEHVFILNQDNKEPLDIVSMCKRFSNDLDCALENYTQMLITQMHKNILENSPQQLIDNHRKNPLNRKVFDKKIDQMFEQFNIQDPDCSLRNRVHEDSKVLEAIKASEYIVAHINIPEEMHSHLIKILNNWIPAITTILVE